MAGVSRRGFLAGAAAAAAAATLGAPRVHAQKKGGTIRFIPHADLKVLDPVATTAYITRNHSYFIYDTLFGTDADLAIKPQMVADRKSTRLNSSHTVISYAVFCLKKKKKKNNKQ